MASTASPIVDADRLLKRWAEEHWQYRFIQYTPKRKDRDAFVEALEKGFLFAQVALAMTAFLSSEEGSLEQFLNQLATEALLEPLLARAYLSSHNYIQELAKELECLRGAWMPSATTEARTAEIEQILEELC